ncbi:orotate phosphoribosyltransferase [Candidatus Woesearchaeota archaeon]|nr:orotate phosphoribosyltransferase [Candidatus Woesearchaeota archaeon]
MIEQIRQQEIARILLEKHAVIINPIKPFTYASGMKSPIYCDNRALLSYPDARDKIVDAMLHIIAQKVQDFDIIAGVATAGIPWASIIADRLEKPLIYVRAKPKEHGRENQIEGRFERGQRVLIIEDHISTGGSSVRAIHPVRDAGGIVECCLAISSYEMAEAEEAFRNANCRLYTGTVFSAIGEEATALGRITEDQKRIVLDWKTDPKGWAKKYGFE